MTTIYDQLQGVASDVLSNFSQGDVFYLAPGADTDTGTDWDPQPSEPVRHELDATVRGVAQRYVDGTSILATDLQMVAAVLPDGTQIGTEGQVEVDGRLHEIIRTQRTPAAGTQVSWLVFLRA